LDRCSIDRTDFSGRYRCEYYFRVAPFFETASPKYDWLNRIVPVGVGQRGPTDVSYTVHELL
jgi:hypothetical protein